MDVGDDEAAAQACSRFEVDQHVAIAGLDGVDVGQAARVPSN